MKRKYKDKYKQRQAMLTSPTQLRRLAVEIEEEYNKVLDETGFKIPTNKNCLVPIVNKTMASDTWRFEMEKKRWDKFGRVEPKKTCTKSKK